MTEFFILLQLVLLLFMLFHDWIPIPPLNDVPALKRADTHRLLGSVINGMTVLIPLVLTWIYFGWIEIPTFAAISVFLFYLLLTIGTILSWWVPYFFGSSQRHKEEFRKFKNTHHFLPSRGDNVVPNTLHVILHLQIWLCLGLSLYFLLTQ